MLDVLQGYIPDAAFEQVAKLLSQDNLLVKIKQERKTRHGDYRRLPNGKHQITINSNLNPYRFLITLIHEIAHFEAYKSYGKLIKPHGPEWKSVFQHLMLPFLRPEIFPSTVLPFLVAHFKNPKASSDSDTVLALKLKQFDVPNGKHLSLKFQRVLCLHCTMVKCSVKALKDVHVSNVLIWLQVGCMFLIPMQKLNY